VRGLGDIDNLLLEALDFLVRALTCASRKVKLRKFHADVSFANIRKSGDSESRVSPSGRPIEQDRSCWR
jgi:hypothetical protein